MFVNKRMYRDVWDSIWIFSQSVDHEGIRGEVKKYAREQLGNRGPSKHVLGLRGLALPANMQAGFQQMP